MSAYVISEVDVRDMAGFAAYRTIAAKTIAQYGGRYLVRGDAASVIEGGPPPKTIIVVEFPTMERLREWYASPEYAEALKLRRTALDRRLIFVEGVAPVEACDGTLLKPPASGDIVAHSTRCGAAFLSEQEREKSVFPAAALMRFEEEPDEEVVHDCGGRVAGCDDG